MQLKGQNALVTGGAGGIGAAIASRLVREGANVAVVDAVAANLDALRALATAPGQRIDGWTCDATRPDEVSATCAAIAESIGAPSILINNVGGSGSLRQDGVEDVTDGAWDAVLSLNLGSTMRFSRSVVPAMKRAGFGRIVNLSSTLKDGIFGPVGTLGSKLAYVTAKSAIVGMTRQLAKDLGPFGVTANAIAPGLTLPGEDARITQKFRALSAEARHQLTAHIPAGRLGSGEDMANAVCFLVSPASGYVNGEVLSIAGGA